MTYLHFNKANGYPYGNPLDVTRLKEYKQERAQVRTIMHSSGHYSIKRDDGENLANVEHRAKTEV
jgi:hypothetical protein